MKRIPTRTGVIYVDNDKHLEWLSVGDYGKENNLKADFLGLTKKVEGVEHKSVDLSEKWVITVSTEKGCSCGCNFCDVPKVGYHGDCSWGEFAYMIRLALEDADCKHTKRLNIHFARMGEPTFNRAVLDFAREDMDNLVRSIIKADVIHPVISTMMPTHRLTHGYNHELGSYLYEWCKIKNSRGGEAGLQLSINSTDEYQRQKMFRGYTLTLEDISIIAKRWPTPLGRKYTLNFAVTEQSIIDPKRLTQLFNPEHFLVKITPIHQTAAALAHGYDVTTSYTGYDVYEKFEQPLLKYGWDVIVFVPSREEDEDRITCGNALLSMEKYKCEQS